MDSNDSIDRAMWALAEAQSSLANILAPLDKILAQVRDVGVCDYEENGTPQCNQMMSALRFTRSKAFALSDNKVQLLHANAALIKSEYQAARHQGPAEKVDACLINMHYAEALFYKELEAFAVIHMPTLKDQANVYVRTHEGAMIAKALKLAEQKVEHHDKCAERFFAAEYRAAKKAAKRKADVPLDALRIQEENAERDIPLEYVAQRMIIKNTEEKIKASAALCAEAKAAAAAADATLFDAKTTEKDVEMANATLANVVASAHSALAAANASLAESQAVISGAASASSVYNALAEDDREAAEALLALSNFASAAPISRAKRARIAK